MRGMVLVEDPSTREVLQSILRARGYDILPGTGDADVDLVMVDADGAEGEGAALCRKLTAEDTDTVVLAVGGRAALAAAAATVAAGASDVLFVPLDAAEIELRLGMAERTLVERSLARKRAEETRESEDRYRALSLATFEAVALHEDGKILDVNDAFARMFGYTIAESLGMGALAMAAPESVEKVLHNIRSGNTEPYEARGIKKDGTVFAAMLHGRTVVYRGRTVRVTALHDLTEQHAAEAALRRSRAELEELIESMPDGVIAHRKGTIVYANRAFAAAVGFASGRELVGKSVLDYISEDEHGVTRERLAAAERGDAVVPREVHGRARDGSSIIVEVNPGPLVTLDGAPASIAITRDVSEQKRILARLQVADRMASLGTLAAGVAHEINNPIAYVDANLTYVERQLQRVGADAGPWLRKTEDALREAREGLERVTRIVKDLRAFSRGTEGAPQGPADVHDVLASAIKMAWNEIRHRARLIRDLHAIPRVAASADRLAQVFLNLLVNAAQALDEGAAGTNEIRVATSLDAQGRVVVEVADTGRGIAPEHLPRLFEPFFTTKPIGIGTGLGLAICHGLVTSMGGEILVESTVGRGSVFRVLLPAAGRESCAPAPPAGGEAASRPRARVLLVDDEPLIVAATTRLLEEDHDVTATTSATDALDRIKKGARFDVVLCDLMMPEMTGMDFYAAVLRFEPEQAERIVFLTGGAFTPSARSFLDAVPNERLEKPFSFAALDRVVSGRGRAS